MKAKIFLYIMFSFLIGALVAPFFGLELVQLLSFAVGLILGAVFVWQIDKLRNVFICLGVFFVSILLFKIRDNYYVKVNEAVSSRPNNFNLTITDVPVQNEFGYNALATINVPKYLEGKRVQLFLKKYPKPIYSERLTVFGKIKKYDDKSRSTLTEKGLIGSISPYQVVKAGHADGISFMVFGNLYKIRAAINSKLAAALPTEEAGLASGLILGEKSLIDPGLKRNLQASGTTHVIALSGYNITILLGLFLIFDRRLSRKLNLVLPLVLIASFVIMTGASASIIRASIMGFMPIIATYIGRPRNALMAVIFSASLMVLFNPFILLYNVGFQLSFAAMIGILYLAPMFLELIGKKKVYLYAVLAETLCAQIMVLPLLSLYFGQVSIISPISNLIILSIVPISMLASFIIGIAGLISGALAQLVAIPGFVLLKMFIEIINYFGSLSFSTISFKLEGVIWILMYYILLIDGVLLVLKYVKQNQKEEIGKH